MADVKAEIDTAVASLRTKAPWMGRISLFPEERTLILEHIDQLMKAAARVAELERVLLDACREKALHGHTTTLLAESLRLKVPGTEGFETWGEERESKLRTLEAERDTKHQLAATEATMRARAEADLRDMTTERDALRARAAEWTEAQRVFLAAEREAADLREALRSTLEALEASFPGDESVGLPEFPSMPMTEAWGRRVAARAVLAKYGTPPALAPAHAHGTGGATSGG